MRQGPDISVVASLIADPARANMLTALMGGAAFTASELAREAGVALPTASGHLARLLRGELLAVTKQGRHRYYRLAGPEVAGVIESLMGFTGNAGARRLRPGPGDPALRVARVCYDHLAGTRGVELFERLTAQGMIALDATGLALTPAGTERLQAFGIDMAALNALRRPLCRTCLDWSERRPHLAGSLGAALLQRLFALHWISRTPGSRIVTVTRKGEAGFGRLFLA